MRTSPHTLRNLLAAVLPLAAAPVVAQTTASNVLLIVADDFGIEQCASYGVGASPPPTPQLDALAAAGVRFGNAFAYPTCSPTRAAIHTGRRAYRHGVGAALVPASGDPGLGVEEWTLPEVLDRAGSGYAHALIGKWHLGDPTNAGNLAPNVAGWSHFAGSLLGAVPDYESWRRVENGVARRTTDYATSRQVDDALDWIGRQTGPWFLVLAFNAPHTPYHAPPAHLHHQNLNGLDPQTSPGPFYDAMVEAMDTEIGRLLVGLGAQRSRTEVVFVGDNGTAPAVVEAPFDRRHAKGTVYRGGVQVPLLVAGPSVVAGGRVVDDPVEIVDLFPTLLGLAGVDAFATLPAGVVCDGVDLGGLLADPQASGARRLQFAEQFGTGLDAEATVRDAGHKLLRSIAATSGAESFELYDLAVDPWEQNDLLARPLDAVAQRAFEDLRVGLAEAREEGLALAFGQGCAGAGLRSSGDLPQLGGRLELDVSGATGAGFLVVGASRDELADGTPLPVPLDALGWAGCSLLVSTDIAEPLVAGAAGPDWSAVLPTDPALLGAVFHLQAATLTGAVTDAVTGVVGG